MGWLFSRHLARQTASLTNLKLDHYKVRDDHADMLNEHGTELQKHSLELQHTRELAMRSEQEFKTLLKTNNDKFDQIIALASKVIK